ncbi:hypothetical protein BDQ12DRAFT_715379 [Crucibulum laeve]|uniref:Rhodopsin domain-containing protein n=1 Tax=Crucibulum laeve TaxID=68775 RepID=A0A5C3LZY3_9AGAR|nr:hypothetical protein BDQ12DRAFT_715379 [Crucibulum laeve]
MIPAQPYLPWKVSISILHVIGISSSVLRVEYRRRTRRLWWDDYASIVPAAFERYGSPDHSEYVRQLKIALSYMNMASLSIIIWWSRISLALAVVRITPVWSKTRLWVIGFTCAFIMAWIALLLAMMVTCAVRTDWQHVRADIVLCGPSYGITNATLPTNLTSDMILFGFPLYRLWYIKLRPAQRRLVLFVFSTSILSLAGEVAVAIVTYGKLFNGPGALLVWSMTSNIYQAIMVFACNLPVLISWGYRVYSRDDDDEPGDHITPHWSRVSPSELSTPSFVLSDLSGSRSQNYENVVRISVSEASLPSQIKTQREESVNAEWKVREEVPDTISRKEIIV